MALPGPKVSTHFGLEIPEVNWVKIDTGNPMYSLLFTAPLRITC